MIVRGHTFEPEAQYGAPRSTCPCGVVQVWVSLARGRHAFRYQTPPLVGAGHRLREIPLTECRHAEVAS